MVLQVGGEGGGGGGGSAGQGRRRSLSRRRHTRSSVPSLTGQGHGLSVPATLAVHGQGHTVTLHAFLNVKLSQQNTSLMSQFVIESTELIIRDL